MYSVYVRHTQSEQSSPKYLVGSRSGVWFSAIVQFMLDNAECVVTPNCYYYPERGTQTSDKCDANELRGKDDASKQPTAVNVVTTLFRA